MDTEGSKKLSNMIDKKIAIDQGLLSKIMFDKAVTKKDIN